MSSLNLLTEEVITLGQARNLLPQVKGLKRPNLSTIFRWAHRGIGGKKLETVRIGSRILTSKQAMTRFIAAISDRN